METGNIQGALALFDNARDSYTRSFDGWIDQTSKYIQPCRDILAFEVDVHLSKAETALTHLVTLNSFYINWHLMRAEWYASPSFIVIITSIWGVIQVIWKVIQAVASVLNLIQALHIDDILYKIWPYWRETTDKIRVWLAQLSDTIGWGVDGLLHLIHATQAGVSVLAGFSKKSPEWLEFDWLQKTEGVISQIKTHVDDLEYIPGKIIDWIAQLGGQETWAESWVFWDKIDDKLENIVEVAEDTTFKIGQVTTELAALGARLPYYVSKYIPQSVWDGINKADFIINDKILPTISAISQKLDEIDAVMEEYRKKAAELAAKLALPGDLMKGVDELPDIVRLNQEGKIDDITSREFERQTDDILDGMTGDIEEFERIHSALTAPIPSPGFMTLESPERKAITGIIEEPRETWFVGDF